MKYIGYVALFVAAVFVGHWAVAPWAAENAQMSSTLEEPKKKDSPKTSPEEAKPEEDKKPTTH